MPSRRCPTCRRVIPASAYRAHLREQHGQRNGSTSAWRRLRAQVIARDHYRCTLCGSTERLEVHHLDWDATNDEPVNLTTRCLGCHHNVHD